MIIIFLSCYISFRRDSQVDRHGGILLNIFEDGDFKRYLVTPEKQDCLELYQGGYRTDGVYQIRQPSGEAVYVWCDMADGGWTVILRRQDGSEDFNRGWDEYVSGFGNLSGEYWLGLESIHLLTVHDSSLKVYADTFGDVTPPTMYAVYDSVAVQDVSTNYRLEVSGFSGDCGDSLSSHNNMPFTTMDRDNDQHTGTNCAAQTSGGWWYGACHSTSPTGRYMNGAFSNDYYAKAMVWYECWGHHYSPKSFIIKIRRNKTVTKEMPTKKDMKSIAAK